MRALSREAIREVDRRATEDLAIPPLCLMENAGAGAAGAALEALAGSTGPVLIACGPGNNGGDGMVVARHLAIAGVDVRIVLLHSSSGREPGGDAAVQLRTCRAMGLPIRAIVAPADVAEALADAAAADLVVDALFGIGLTRALEGTAAAIVERVNASGRVVLALDVPSGLDADTGEPLGACVRARTTVTFAAPKLGFENPASRRWTGDVRVVGIGAPVEWP